MVEEMSRPRSIGPTPMEALVLWELIRGRTVKEAARRLGRSPRTVEHCKYRLMDRLDELLRYAREHNLTRKGNQ